MTDPKQMCAKTEECQGKLQMFFDSILQKTCIFPMRHLSDVCAVQHQLHSLLVPSDTSRTIEIPSWQFYNAWYDQQKRYCALGNVATTKMCIDNNTFTYQHIPHPFTHELIEDFYRIRLQNKMPGVIILDSQYVGNTLKK